ncbi:hypothetical protein Rsub_07902 [Raphidocelis subcapitata]|uniref:NADH:ubiquinone oxidoreductase intermediate-associated protein 30 domain-containing protein n=1 Tax=Raphidocelis subcapitata TaxID=307507 RepID=A0A2V0PDE5_9CHLO|nr:hypothetical protein Rsub_07902 [Raphidocelis subcapitata]|eukprot:GBF95187.1 hypothetical protein Rsub_07902 [Raphidocelis subcapitata]
MLRSFARSLQRVGRALAGEVPMNPQPMVLFKFDREREVDKWHAFTDAYFGGRSEASWALAPDQPAAEFSGRCSTEMDEGADLARAGYCCATSKVDAIGDYFDLECYSALVYTVSGDGNTYLANLRVDSMAGGGGDVWQAPLPTRADGAWTEVRVPLRAFVMTHKGRVVERRMEIPRTRVMSMGVSVSALAGMGPQEAGAAGVSQRPAPAAGAGGAATGGGGGSGASSSGGSAAGEESSSGSSSGGGGGGLLNSSTFRLLLREIRAEGRAGGEDDAPGKW